jgi:ABC-2 type transport system ATP-binding protein
VIEVCGLTRYYGSSPAILDVNFQVARGEVVGFLGPNGAGKTTTMRILAGCLAPTDGTARVAGYDIFEQSLEARRSLGYLPEQVPLYPEMRVEEYLVFAASLRMADTGPLPERLEEVMDRCGLVDRRRALIGTLSRGYRQRVGLAQAILHNPPAVILDEPTVGLDPRQIIEVRELIRDLAADHTVLLSTHILPEVSMLCSRVVIIDHGRVVAEGTPSSLARAALGGERLILDVEGPADEIAGRLRSLAGIVSVSADANGNAREPDPFAGQVARLSVDTAAGGEADARRLRRAVASEVVSAGYGLLELRAERVSLEDTFVRLITSEER